MVVVQAKTMMARIASNASAIRPARKAAIPLLWFQACEPEYDFDGAGEPGPNECVAIDCLSPAAHPTDVR